MTQNRNNEQIPSGAEYGVGGVDAQTRGGHGYGMGGGTPVPQPVPRGGVSGQQAQPQGYPRGQQQWGYGYQQSHAQPGAQGQQAQGAPGQPYGQYAPQYAQYMAAQAAGYQAPATSQAQPQKKRRRGPVFWVAIAVVILAIAAACLIAFQMCDGGKNRSGDLGQLEGKTAEQIQAEIDRQVDEGMFNISIASIVQFADGTSPGELKIENVPGNRYLMQVAITLDDGRQVYESGVMEPNHHIQSDRLSVDLDAGTYPAIATFTALDPETEEEIGQAAAQITLVVAA